MTAARGKTGDSIATRKVASGSSIWKNCTHGLIAKILSPLVPRRGKFPCLGYTWRSRFLCVGALTVALFSGSGCVGNRSGNVADVSVLLFLEGNYIGRSDKTRFGTFVDVGVRIDRNVAAEMLRIVDSCERTESGLAFVGIESYQLFLRNGIPEVLVELLVNGTAIVGKVKELKKIRGGYYLVREERGDLPWTVFKSKRYADFFHETLCSLLREKGDDILHKSIINGRAVNDFAIDMINLKMENK